MDAQFSEPMGGSALDTNKYELTTGRGTLTPHPHKVIRLSPTMYRLLWNSGDICYPDTYFAVMLSSVRDVAGNEVPYYYWCAAPGTKRMSAVNCGSLNSAPFDPDGGFLGNEVATTFLMGTASIFETNRYIDTYYVTDPAPQGVYKTMRCRLDDTTPFTYRFPVDAGTYKVRLHFADLLYNAVPGKQVFDIMISGWLVATNFDLANYVWGGFVAYVLEVPNVSPNYGEIRVELRPKPSTAQGDSGHYRASINGIEILKP